MKEIGPLHYQSLWCSENTSNNISCHPRNLVQIVRLFQNLLNFFADIWELKSIGLGSEKLQLLSKWGKNMHNKLKCWNYSRKRCLKLKKLIIFWKGLLRYEADAEVFNSYLILNEKQESLVGIVLTNVDNSIKKRAEQRQKNCTDKSRTQKSNQNLTSIV